MSRVLTCTQRIIRGPAAEGVPGPTLILCSRKTWLPEHARRRDEGAHGSALLLVSRVRHLLSHKDLDIPPRALRRYSGAEALLQRVVLLLALTLL